MVRFNDWYYFLALVIIAALDSNIGAEPIKVFYALIFNLVYLSLGYLSNNFFDLNEDDEKKNAFKDNDVSPRRQAIITGALSLCFLGSSIFLDLFGPSLFIFFVNFLYLVPPFRLKNQYIFAAAANGAFFSFVYFSSAKLIDSDLSPFAWEFTIYIFLIMIFVQHLNHLENRLGEANRVPESAFGQLVAIAVLITVYLYGFSSALTVLLKLVSLLFLGGCLLLLATKPTIGGARKLFRYAGFGLGLAIFLERLFA